MRWILTKRLLWIALIGALLILLAGLAGGVWAVVSFLLVNLLLLALVILDGRATPSPKCLSVHRQLDVKLSLGTPSEVTLLVTNPCNVPLFVEVEDQIPQHFQHTQKRAGQWVAAHGQARYPYTLTPRKRGDFLFPAIYLRLHGVYGLVDKQVRVAGDVRYQVYPNMRDLTEYRLSALGKNTFLQGVRRVPRPASSGEFESLREYQEKDPYNTINWAATARRNELVVNTYTPERNQYVYILLDSSRVMNSEIHEIKKLDYAINAAFLLSDYCVRGGDNVGLMVFDHQVRRFLPASNRQAQWEAIGKNLYDVECSETSANYLEAIRTFAQKQRRRSLVFLYTELFNADEAIRLADAVRTHLAGHLVYTITIQDPRIREMAQEEGSTTEDIYRKAAAMKLWEERKKIRQVLQSAGMMNSDIDPDTLSLEVVNRYLDIKRSGRL